MTKFYLRSTKSYQANGNLENKQTFTYNLSGQIVSETDVNYDFTLFGSTSDYIYNSNGNLILETSTSISDNNGDGIADYTTTKTYNALGNIIDVIFKSSNDYSDETYTIKTNYIYDSNHNLITETYDYDDAQSVTKTYTYDSNYNLITETYSNAEDDLNNSIYNYTYDGNNNLITETYDYLGNGTDVEIYTYTYDINNNLIEEILDYDGDGISDSKNTYTYDSRNNLIAEAHDIFDSGFLANKITYTYDAKNNLTLQAHDDDGDGVIDRMDTYTYTYDENDNLIAQTYDESSDGIDRTTVYEYIRADREVDTNQTPQMLLTDVHRLYQFEKGYHLYTSDTNELSHIGKKVRSGELSYNYESAKYRVLANNKDTVTGEKIAGVKPIYRFYNNQTGAHLYTMDEYEKDNIRENLSNYDFEDIKYYAFESEPKNIATIPVYRLLNNQSGAHLFSSDINEVNHLERNEPHFSIENNGNAAFYVLEI